MDRKIIKLAGAAMLALGVLQISAPDAFAAKEKFERSKPHVNVGTIGPTSSETSGGTMTTAPDATTETTPDCEPDPAKAAETSRPPC